MGTLKVQLRSGRNAATLSNIFERSGAPRAIINDLAKFVEAINGGAETNRQVAISVLENETYASGTFTLSSVVATDVVTINGVSFTAVASGATGNQFNVGGSDAVTATNLAAAINASVTALVDGYVTAEAEDEVVTVTAAEPGLLGNAITIASADATIVASGARLTGGAADADARTITL